MPLANVESFLVLIVHDKLEIFTVLCLQHFRSGINITFFLHHQSNLVDFVYVSIDETLIAVCIGMHLHPMLSEDLMSKAGKQLQKTQKHTCYGIILCDHYMGTVAEANAFLKQFGYEPLSKAA